MKQVSGSPKILLNFTSKGLHEEDWSPYGSEKHAVRYFTEFDDALGKRVLMKKGHGFNAALRHKPADAPPLDWRFRYYELAVRLDPESAICINVSHTTGEDHTLIYSSAIVSGVGEPREFHIPLDREVSDGAWHSLIIDLPEHVKQARWPSFARVNWLSLRGEVALAAIRGCDDEDSLIQSAIVAPPHVISQKPKQASAPRLIEKTEEKEADFVIVTALEKEAQAVVRRLENYRIERPEDRDIRTYHCGLVPIQEGDRAYRVVVVQLPDIGEVPAANAAGDAIRCWKPKYVLMVGIAGGMPKKEPSKDDLDLGDVVVANQIIGYEYSGVTEDGLEPRDRVYPVSQLLLDRVHNFWDQSWVEQVKAPRPDNGRRTLSKQFVGPILSGNKVIKSTEFREQLRGRWPKSLAIEMEGEGVFAAVFSQPEIRHALVIRGICDMADERKSDEWQEYAANAAAAYAIALLRSGPVEPGAPSAHETAKREIENNTRDEPFLIKTTHGTWLVQDGIRRKVPGGPTHRALIRRGFHLQEESDEEARRYPEGESIPDIEPQVVQDQKGQIYLVTRELIIGHTPISDGTKLEIDEQVADYLGDGDPPLLVTAEKLAGLTNLSPLPPDTAEYMRSEPFHFIKGRAGDFTFLLKHRFIRWIPNPQIRDKLAKCLKIRRTSQVPDEELDSYIMGPNISSQPPDHGIENLQKWLSSRL
jgi:nucleoside phosphorylase